MREYSAPNGRERGAQLRTKVSRDTGRHRQTDKQTLPRPPDSENGGHKKDTEDERGGEHREKKDEQIKEGSER